MKKISLPIDVSEYDVRVTWSGLKEDSVSEDAGLIEGFPIDPPDDCSGWLLVNFGVEVAKDADRYWSLWARKKVKPKKRVKRASVAEVKPPRAPRKKRGAAIEIEQAPKDDTTTETN